VVARVAATSGAVWILVALAREEDYVKRGDDGWRDWRRRLPW